MKRAIALTAILSPLVLVALAWGQASAPTYDPAPLLVLLRPEARDGLERQLGVDSLADLPLYEIDQAIDDGTGTFEARLTLHWTNRTGKPVAALPLLLHPNSPEEQGAAAAGSAEMHVDGAETVLGPACEPLQKRPTLVELRFAEPVPAGGRVKVKVRYGGRLRSLAANSNDLFAQGMASMGNVSGSGAADYGLVGVGDGIVTFASAYPMVAPVRNGVFDVARPTRYGDLAYNEPANYSVRTIVPAGTRVVTNLIDGEPQDAGGGTEVVTSCGALVRDIVLVAGRDLRSVSRTVNGVTIRSTYLAQDAKAGKRALDTTAISLGAFERRFGPYPWSELDVAEATLVGGAGGVEFCSMILVAGMFYRPPSKSTSQMKMLMDLWSALGSGIAEGLEGKTKRGGGAAFEDDLLESQFDFVVAHEVAHQYFAGLVGNDSHKHPTLDEPIAQYAAGLVIEDRDGPEAAKKAMDGNVKLNYALYRMLRGADSAVLRDVSTFRSGIEYAGLVYGKAPYLYVKLREQLGDERLHRAIRETVQENRFRILTTDEWIAGLDEKAGGGVLEIAKRWLKETHGDEDLGVDEEGDFVIRSMFDADVANQLKASTEVLGMKPADLLRMLFGGGVGGGEGPAGPGLDPDKALDLLEQLGK